MSPFTENGSRKALTRSEQFIYRVLRPAAMWITGGLTFAGFGFLGREAGMLGAELVCPPPKLGEPLIPIEIDWVSAANMAGFPQHAAQTTNAFCSSVPVSQYFLVADFGMVALALTGGIVFAPRAANWVNNQIVTRLFPPMDSRLAAELVKNAPVIRNRYNR